MTDKVVKYISPICQTDMCADTSVLDTSNQLGVKCVWSGTIDNDTVNFAWEFDWSELKKRKANRITGDIHVTVTTQNFQTKEATIDVDWKGNKKVIETVIEPERDNDFQYEVFCNFTYTLKLHGLPEEQQSNYLLFQPDTATLMIERQKIDVNKSLLASHSEYFRNLFTSSQGDAGWIAYGQMNKYSIKNVSSKDFELLLSTINGKKISFASDEAAKKLLALANRFEMPSLLKKAENHLKSNSKM